MTKELYEKISRPFNEGTSKTLLLITNKLLTAIGYATYPLMLLYMFFKAPEKLVAAILIPGTGFVLLTLVRKAINRPRPYEALDINPIIKKDTKGNSMPSRHVFSMTEIAMTAFLLSPAVGGVLLFFSFTLAFIRVVGGVHYPTDVAAGIISAVSWCGILYMIFL